MYMNIDKICVVDIETDGLLDTVSKIHCASTCRCQGDKVKWGSWYGSNAVLAPSIDGTIRDFIKYINKCSENGYTIVFHNGKGFDLPALHKIYPNITLPPIFDTLALSRVLYPERALHSLESWGEELGIPKQQHDDWDTLSIAMLQRCKSDVEITIKLFKYLIANPDFQLYVNDSFTAPEYLNLEQDVMGIHAKQVQYGVRFNIEAADILYRKLNKKRDKLADKLVAKAPWSCTIPNIAKKNQEKIRAELIKENSKNNNLQRLKKGVLPFKANGDYTVNTTKWFTPDSGVTTLLPNSIDKVGTKVDQVKGVYTKVTFNPLNINSPADVKDFLLSLKWKPTEWNYTFRDGRKSRTSPKLTEDSYTSLPEGIGQDIAEYNILKHRVNFLFNPQLNGKPPKGALSNKRLRVDGRVSAEAITCGTPTARYRHKGIVCNIPKPGTPYGSEIRSLFCVPEGRWMVGFDLCSIEARMLAHYILPFPGGKELATIITTGDYHQYNADTWKVTRDLAKGGRYALMYGCYPQKLAEILHKPKTEGQFWYDKFWETNKPIKLLVEAIEEEYSLNGGKIKGLDGRWLYVREKRKLLNTLLQNAAAVVFKKWMILSDEFLMSNKYDFHQVIAYHDELQYESLYSPETSKFKIISKHICDSATEAGKYYKCGVEILADMKVGHNWSETH